MIIGIDGNEANQEMRVGIGQYAYQLLQHLWALRREGTTYTVYLKDAPLADMPLQTEGWQYDVFGPKRLWTQIAFPFRLYSDNPQPDIVFSPSHYAPRFSPVPRIISIMDLSFLHFPELFTAKDLHQLRSWTAYSVQKSAHIFTISKFSKHDIMAQYHLPDSHVTVTYPGYDQQRYCGKRPLTLVEQTLLAGYGISSDYILFVGTVQPRKNIIRLIEAFEIIKKTHPALQLVIAGKKGWLWEESLTRMQTSAHSRDILHIDFVPDADLPVLYRGARCFVLPSLYEGFGIPVIEAMACGTPVVASNVSSLPEIVGAAGILVDPQQPRQLADALVEAGYNENRREQLIEKGLENVKRFSWKTCAEETMDVLLTIKK